MSVKISELAEIQDPPLTGLIPVVVGGATRKATLQDLVGSVTGGTVTSLTFTGNLSAIPNPITESGNVFFNLPGMIFPFASAVAPSGWVFCNGQALSRTTYADLFQVISTTYGSGDGSTTFNVPDLRGRLPFGRAFTSTETNRLSGEAISPNIYTLGAVGGAENHLLTGSQTAVRTHTHTGSGKKRIYGSTNYIFYNGDCRTPGSYCDYNLPGNIVEGVSTGGWSGSPIHHFELSNVNTLSSNSNPYHADLLSSGGGSKTQQTITWSQTLPNTTLPFTPVVLSATASSTLTVTFRVHSGPATLSGNTLSVTGPGWVCVEAVQSGNATYDPVVLAKSFFVSHLPHNNMPPCQVVNYIIKT